jgi:branched-chain amino acid transport system ATP-binding protein
MKILEISQIEKNFGGLRALSDVEINIEEGEVYGLIGTNGSGKTTLFNIICGFLKPEKGYIKFKDNDITNFAPEEVCKMGIGRCFQTVQPFRSMTPMENARVARAYGRKIGASRELSLDEIMEIVGLNDKQDILTEHLTLPDKKNVEIARALAGNPELILFDEIASGLTGKEIEGRIDLMKRLSQMGITIIVVEHIMRFIKEISHRIGVLHTGQLICEGDPQTVASDEKVIEAYLGEKNHEYA